MPGSALPLFGNVENILLQDVVHFGPSDNICINEISLAWNSIVLALNSEKCKYEFLSLHYNLLVGGKMENTKKGSFHAIKRLFNNMWGDRQRNEIIKTK